MDTGISPRNPNPHPPSFLKATDSSRKTKKREQKQKRSLILPLADPLVINPETGFLEASRVSALSSLKKVRFLELYRMEPNASACARAVGTTARTIHYHLERDEAFKAAFDQVREELADEIEGKVFEFAKRPQNFLDRITFLKAFRPERWNPEYKITLRPDSQITHALAKEAKKLLQ